MAPLKPIVIIESDSNCTNLLVEAYSTLDFQNDLLVFYDSSTAYEHLLKNAVIPFLVISDILMPKMSGLELAERLHTHPEFSAYFIPFVFLTGTDELPCTNDRMGFLNQGYFEKKGNLEELRKTLDIIISYWNNR